MIAQFEQNLLFEKGNLSIEHELAADPKLEILLQVFLSLDIKKFETTKKFISNICQSMKSSKNENLLFKFALFLFKIYNIENTTGQEFNYVDVERKIKQEIQWRSQEVYYPGNNQNDQIESLFKQLNIQWILKLISYQKLSRFNYQYLIIDNCKRMSSPELIEALSLGGEQFKKLIKYKQLFFYTLTILDWLKQQNIPFETLDLWRGRVYFKLNEVLYTPVNECTQVCLQAYTNVLQVLSAKIDRKSLSFLFVEYSGVLLFYYKYKKANYYLQQAEKLLRIQFELTGKLGVRTKYQEDKTAQLIAQAVLLKEDQIELDKELCTLPSVDQILHQFSAQIIQPQHQELDSETILYETPKIDQEEDFKSEIKKDNLDVWEQVLLLGIIENLLQTNPKDEVLQEQTEAYLNLMLSKPNHWLVYSKGLLLRSLNEFSKFKRMERALAQLQSLVDQINDSTPSGNERYSLFYALQYPDSLTLNKTLAEHWIKGGGMQSGYEIFSRLEMWEECMECLINQGDFERATKEIEQLRSQGQVTLKMNCLLGEMKNDIKLLKQTWKDSNKKFARVQRSLGDIYFFKFKNYEKSAKAYSKALKINTYHGRSWFIQGCAYMRLNKLNDAIKSFGQCVTVDESNGEAWANMAGCLEVQGQLINAMATLEQAAKYNEGDWRIWSNLVSLSLKNKKFNRFYVCIEKLVLLQHKELIDENMLKKINQTISYQIQQYSDEKKRQLKIQKDRVDRLYQFLTREVSSKPEIYNFYADACLLFQLVEELITEDQKQQIIEESKVQFKIETQNLTNKEKRLKDLDKKVAYLRLNCVQTSMIVGWETDIKSCQKIHQYILKLVESYEKVDSIDDQKNLSLLLQAIIPKLEKTLAIKISLE